LFWSSFARRFLTQNVFAPVAMFNFAALVQAQVCKIQPLLLPQTKNILSQKAASKGVVSLKTKEGRLNPKKLSGQARSF
jgi:hypothetical protein